MKSLTRLCLQRDRQGAGETLLLLLPVIVGTAATTETLGITMQMMDALARAILVGAEVFAMSTSSATGTTVATMEQRQT